MKMHLVPGETWDIVTPEEMHGHMQSIQARMTEFIRQEYVGVKPIRFACRAQTVLAATSVRLISEISPRSGYIWSIQFVNVLDTASAGTSPAGAAYLCRTTEPTDVPLLPSATTISDSALPFVVDEFPTNAHKALTYGKGQMLFQAGEIPMVLWYNNAGATSQVTMLGQAIEVPAEMIGKLLT